MRPCLADVRVLSELVVVLDCIFDFSEPRCHDAAAEKFCCILCAHGVLFCIFLQWAPGHESCERAFDFLVAWGVT